MSRKDKYLAAAQKLLERGQLDKALVEFARVVQEDPKDTRTWLKMAELHAKQGAAAEATEIYLRTGELYGEQGFAQKAVAVYKNVLKLSPGTVTAHVKLGGLYKQLGLVSDSVQQFEMAAVALQRSGKGGEAVAALRQAVEVQPENLVLRVKLAESASQGGMTEEAVREFARAADQLKTEGRSDEYLRVVERLLFHQPENFGRARELAEAYIAKGSARLALPKLQACLKADPRDPRTLSLLAKALEQLGQVPKAVSVLKELMRLYGELGRASERDAAILRALTLDPADPELAAAAARYQLRGPVGAGADPTPPPHPLGREAPGGGSFDISGATRLPGTGASGRVAAPISGATTGRMSGSLGSAASAASPEQALARILAESEVFVKYGLLERAADHLARVFSIDSGHRPAREKLITVLEQLGRSADADRHRAVLAEQLAAVAPAAAPVDSGPTLDADDFEIVDEADDPAVDLLTPPPSPWSSSWSSSSSSSSSRVAAPAAAATPPPEGTRGSAPKPAPAAPAPGAAREMATTSADVAAEFELAEPTPMPLLPDLSGPAEAGRADGAAPMSSKAPAPDLLGREQAGAGAPAAALAAGAAEEIAGELEQVAFFLAHALEDDARALLEDLAARYPGDPEVAAQVRALAPPPRPAAARPAAARPAAASPTTGGDASEPAAAPPVPGALPGAAPRPASLGVSLEHTPAPRAIVADGQAADLSTHADLGIAYKEMGLYDAAITEFKLLTQDPRREVFALTMMGECFEAKGSITEAVIRYKRALNCDDVSETENLDLYFLLGCAFERLGDVGEALYFFEKVAKRDAKFREVDRKLTDLKPRMARRA